MLILYTEPLSSLYISDRMRKSNSNNQTVSKRENPKKSKFSFKRQDAISLQGHRLEESMSCKVEPHNTFFSLYFTRSKCVKPKQWIHIPLTFLSHFIVKGTWWEKWCEIRMRTCDGKMWWECYNSSELSFQLTSHFQEDDVSIVDCKIVINSIIKLGYPFRGELLLIWCLGTFLISHKS